MFLYAFTFFILNSSPAFALSLQVDGTGQLTGATGVDVGGSLYDVQFVDGTCIAVFSGCDENADFTFQNRADATIASQALLDMVFIDGASGLFDSTPSATVGCEFGIGIIHTCSTATPFMLSNGGFNGALAVDMMLAAQGVSEGEDFTFFSQPSPSLDFSSLPNATWAVWTKNQTAPIPEPSTFLLLVSGFAGLAGWQYRKKLHK